MQLLEDFFNDIDNISIKDETLQDANPKQKTTDDFSVKFIISYKFTKEKHKLFDFNTDLAVYKRICYIFRKSDFTSDDFIINAMLWTMDKNDWGKTPYKVEDTEANNKQLIQSLKKLHKAKAPAIELTYRIYCDITKTSYKTYVKNMIKLSKTVNSILDCYDVHKFSMEPIYDSSICLQIDLPYNISPYSNDLTLSYETIFKEKADRNSITTTHKEGGGQHILTYLLKLEQRQPFKEYHITVYGYVMHTSSASTEILINLKPQLTGSNETGNIIQFVKRYFVNAMDNSDIDYICIYNNSGNIHFKILVDASNIELTTIPGTSKKTSISGHLIKYGQQPYESNSDYIISLADTETRSYIMDDGRLQGECMFETEFENIKQKWEKFKQRHI